MVVRTLFRPVLMVYGLHFQAAYTHRSIWSIGFVIIGVLWPYGAWSPSTLSQNWKLALQWAFSCLVTAVFPFLPVDKEESLLSM